MKTVTLVAALVAAPALAAPSQERRPWVDGEIIVQLKGRTSSADEDRAARRAGGRVLERVNPRAIERGAPGLLRMQTALSVEDAIARLEADPDVAYAEPNWRCRTEVVSNDQYYASGGQWGVFSADATVGPSTTTNQYGCGAEKAWAGGQTGSRTVYVGVVDEGVQFAHPDLAANVWTNPYDPVNGVDDDRNGFVDDVHGWDFFSGDNSVYDGIEDNHGTHVAGTIGAVGGNSSGVAGVCWNVTMIPMKFMGADGGSVSGAVRALDYLTDLKTRHGLRIVATNNSWSIAGYSQSLNDAILRAAKQGILTVCAAGNSSASNDTTAVYPANYDTRRATSTQSAATYDAVIAVAAIDKLGALASYSDYGVTNVDLGAPGSSIISTVPTSTYAYFSGTSMAAPHVTGAIALLAAANTGMLASEIRDRLLGAVAPTPSLSGKTVTGGRLDLSSLSRVRDVAVASLGAPSFARKGATVTVTVGVVNAGSETETFTVAMRDTPPAGGVAGTFGVPRSVTLAPGAASSVSFAWTTTRASVGTHVLTATASTVAGETRVADNSRSRSVTLTAATFAPTAAAVSSGDSTTEAVAASGEEPEERPRLRTGLAEPSAAR